MTTKKNNRVFITGMGAVTPFGAGTDTLWQGLLSGHSAMKPITLFDASSFRNSHAGEVDGYAPDPESPRAYRMLNDAVTEAVQDANRHARRTLKPDRTGIILGTNFGCITVAEKKLTCHADIPVFSSEADRPSLSRYLFDETAANLAADIDAIGPRAVISLSCASGTAVIGQAFDWLRAGVCDAVIAAGFDELSLYNYSGLSALRSITPDIVRPFDNRRRGTLFSEGAGCLILESGRMVERRGATAHAEVLGWAANNDAFHMTAPEKSGRGIIAVMAAALAHAGLAPETIDHINAHATGTVYNDQIETHAIKHVFGAHAADLTIAANKSCLGHGMGAAGCWEAIATVHTIKEKKIPPTLGLEQPDPELDLDYCAGGIRNQDVSHALSCSYGFGGTNAAVVFQRVDMPVFSR